MNRGSFATPPVCKIGFTLQSIYTCYHSCPSQQIMSYLTQNYRNRVKKHEAQREPSSSLMRRFSSPRRSFSW